MSVCAYVMSKGVHNIAFSVTPDVKHPRSIRDLPHALDKGCAYYYTDYGAIYMPNMVIILVVMYSNVVTAIDKIHTSLLRFNTN